MGTKAVIHLENFLHNIREVQNRIGPNRRICVPVKANGYGHGAVEISRASIQAGAYCLGVSSVTEAIELRKGGIGALIFIFAQPHPSEIHEIIEGDFCPFVSDREFVDLLDREAAGKKIKVNMKIDTGMGRLGCAAEDAPAFARYLKSKNSIDYMGTATHLAVSDSAAAEHVDYTGKQLARFRDAVENIRAAGVNPGIIHAANSGGVILHPESWFDMVRPGIFLYGYKTANEADLPDTGKPLEPLDPKPVMELKTQVVFVKKVKKGQSVSYGRIWTADRDTTVATLHIGYADGFPRCASNKWQAVISGRTYPVVGRICMDQCMADLGPDTNVRRWDEAVIFGGPAPSAAEMADKTGTFIYEVTCNINRRVPRVYEK